MSVEIVVQSGWFHEDGIVEWMAETRRDNNGEGKAGWEKRQRAHGSWPIHERPNRYDVVELADGWEWTERGSMLGESWQMRHRVRWVES